MKMLTLLLIFGSIDSAVGQLTGLCSEANRTANLQPCLVEIGKAVEDASLFWFGTGYSQRCPQGVQSEGFDCSKLPGTQLPQTISAGVFTPGTFDPSTLDRYIDVSYTSPSGQYSGCGNDYVIEKTVTFTLDPLSMETYPSWDAREMPEMTWDSSPGQLFSLVVYDVPFGFIHGIYANIPGNDFAQSEVIKAYHGPLYGGRLGNVYAFLLFLQPQRINVDPRFAQQVPGQPFNVSEFREVHSLTGPVAMNWLLAKGDPYSVERQKAWGTQNNCPMFVADAAMTQGISFLADGKDVHISVDVTFNSKTIGFTSCCEYFYEESQSVAANPLGGGYIKPVLSRDEPRVDLTTAKADKLYALAMVDTDVPLPAFGTKDRPLLHWLNINIPGGVVSNGDNVSPYFGPGPPDQNPHHYYFLLYEQQGALMEESHIPYVGASCSGRLQNRCLFDVSGFASGNGLRLVGASWFLARHDEFVRYSQVTRGVPKEEACRDVPGYRGFCLTTAGSSRLEASIGLLSSILLLLSFFNI